MIFVADQLLQATEVAQLRGLFDREPLSDGGDSAAATLREVKHNREVALGDRTQFVKDLLLSACNRAPQLNLALLPRKVSSPFLSSYRSGMYYGSHTDSAIGQDEDRVYRVDLSCTVFLDPPDAYQGGELQIDTDFGSKNYKLGAGDAVFYPTIFVHRVQPVTAGERRACVFWLESLVRDPAKRSILFELAQVSAWLSEREPADSQPRQTLVKVRENLYRMWLEP